MLLNIKKLTFHLVKFLAAVQPVIVDEAQKSNAWGWSEYTLIAIDVIVVSCLGYQFVGPALIKLLGEAIRSDDVFDQLTRGTTEVVVDKITAAITSYVTLPAATDATIAVFVEDIAKALERSWGADQSAQILYMVLKRLPEQTINDAYAYLWVHKLATLL